MINDTSVAPTATTAECMADSSMLEFESTPMKFLRVGLNANSLLGL